MITQKEINRYIKDIKKELLYGTKESRQFLKELKQNVTDYAEENQNADMAQVTEQFGTPEDIAATFFEQYGKEDIKKKVNIRRVVIVALTIAITMFIIALAIELIDASNNFDTQKKLRCGKWTREIIINRLKRNYEEYGNDFYKDGKAEWLNG